MMLVSKIIFMVLVLSGVSANFNFKVNTYKWDEKIKMCSPDVNILADVICSYDQKDDSSSWSRPSRSPRKRLNLNQECCINTCTPDEILKKYCLHPERMDTTTDLKIFNVESYEPSTSSTTPEPTTQAIDADDEFSTLSFTTKVMYCYMGLLVHCNDGVQHKLNEIFNSIHNMG